MSVYRRSYRARVKGKLVAIRAQFDAERRDLLDMVRRECAAILEEAGARRREKQPEEQPLFPEMISPEQTLE